MTKRHKPMDINILEKIKELYDPGKQTCDCIEKSSYNGEFWSYECQCMNPGDQCEAAAWCRLANKYDDLIKIISTEQSATKR